MSPCNLFCSHFHKVQVCRFMLNFARPLSIYCRGTAPGPFGKGADVVYETLGPGMSARV